MSSQKKKQPTELPKLKRKSAQYTKKSNIRIPKRGRNDQPRFHLTDLQDNSEDP